MSLARPTAPGPAAAAPPDAQNTSRPAQLERRTDSQDRMDRLSRWRSMVKKRRRWASIMDSPKRVNLNFFMDRR
jgi:hypothetical protein